MKSNNINKQIQLLNGDQMHTVEEMLDKVKSMHTSNVIFWITGKSLFGLGLGILLPVYFSNAGWIIAGWILIGFAILLMSPALIAAFHNKGKIESKPKIK